MVVSDAAELLRQFCNEHKNDKGESELMHQLQAVANRDSRVVNIYIDDLIAVGRRSQVIRSLRALPNI